MEVICVYGFIAIVFIFFLFKKHKKSEHGRHKSGLIMVDGNGETRIHLPFTPTRCGVSFLGRDENRDSCNYDHDHLSVHPVHRGLKIKWKVGKSREVSWRAEN